MNKSIVMQKGINLHLSPKTIMKTIFLLFLAITAGCNIQGQNSGLPDQRPADLKLYYHFDGGMVYHFEDLTLSADSCLYIVNEGGKKREKRFSLTPKEMEALYSILRDNRFDRIRSKTESGVYDRGGESIRIEWDKGRRQVGVSNAQMTFVEKAWIKEWNAVLTYVLDLIKKH